MASSSTHVSLDSSSDQIKTLWLQASKSQAKPKTPAWTVTTQSVQELSWPSYLSDCHCPPGKHLAIQLP